MVERLEAFGGCEQEWRRLVPAIGFERDASSKDVHASTLAVVEGTCLRGRNECERVVERACLLFRLGCGERTSGTPDRVNGQVARALEERCGGGEATARLCARRG